MRCAQRFREGDLVLHQSFAPVGGRGLRCFSTSSAAGELLA